MRLGIHRRDLLQLIVTASLVMTLVFVFGCEITESELTPVGSIYISAYDELGVEIIGASITLDGIARPETTPDTLKNIAEGLHTVEVNALGFDPLELDVMVTEEEVVSPIFNLCHCTEGYLQVSTNVADVHIIIDEMVADSTSSPDTPIWIQVDTGPREISAYRPGYKTLPPELLEVMALPDDTVSVSLSLEAGQEGNQVGDIGFDFTLENDFGSMISLHNHRGHIVLVNFWFSQCQPCMEEFPEIEQIFQDYAPYGIRILAINPMFTDDLAAVQQVRAGLGLSFQLLLDYESITAHTYDVVPYPTNIVMAPGGDIVARFGSTSYEELAGIIDGILGQ